MVSRLQFKLKYDKLEMDPKVGLEIGKGWDFGYFIVSMSLIHYSRSLLGLPWDLWKVTNLKKSKRQPNMQLKMFPCLNL